MVTNNSNLSASYINANWLLLSLAFSIFLYSFAGAQINIDLIPVNIPDAKIKSHVFFALYLLAWIYQAIQWRIQESASKVKYLSKVMHLGVNLIAFLICFLCYPKLVVGSPFQGVSFWWIVLYLVLGYFSGSIAAFLSLQTLLIRSQDDAEALGLPKIPLATKLLYVAFVPVLFVILGIYFSIQEHVPNKIVYIGTVLFTLAFLEEVLSLLLPFYFSQDESGYRLRFTEKSSGLRSAYDRHDYSRIVFQRNIKKLENDDYTNLSPEELQQCIVKEIESSNSINYHAEFLGVDNDGNMKIQLTFKDCKIPTEVVEVPSSYFQENFNSYIEKKTKSQANIEEAVSYAFNEATIKVWKEKASKEQKAADVPLSLLVKAKEYELLIQKLKESNEDVNKKGIGGWTPLCHAAANGDEKALRILLEQAADPGIKNLMERAPLHFGARYLNYNICKLLLDYGADPNIRDDLKQTPLMIASLLGGMKLVKLLVERGADVSLIDNQKKKAIDYATEGKHGHIAKLLRTK